MGRMVVQLVALMGLVAFLCAAALMALVALVTFLGVGSVDASCRASV